MGAEERYAIPVKDILVRDPISKYPFPEGGGYVPWIGPVGRYWRKRFKEGSIIIYDKKPDSVVKKIEDVKESKPFVRKEFNKKSRDVEETK